MPKRGMLKSARLSLPEPRPRHRKSAPVVVASKRNLAYLSVTPIVFKNRATVELGAMSTPMKARAARINGLRGGRQPKIHTLKTPCHSQDAE
jgi:hypothetical protein